MKLAALYFDGISANAQQAILSVENAQWIITLPGQAPIVVDASAVRVEDANKNLPRRLTLANGAILEVANQSGFEEMLAATGRSRSTLDRAQNSWKATISAVVGVAALAVITVLWGIPLVATVVANNLPLSADKRVGDQAWPTIEKDMFTPSKLPVERQAALRQRFDQMRAQDPKAPEVELLFRASNIGPNAIAIPGGRIVMTDELIKIADASLVASEADDAILGVLAHEIGHQAHRHSMRQIVQVTAVAGLVSLWFGDLNALAAAAPTLLLANKYSRQFETESDTYALTMMQRSGIDPHAIANLFELLAAQRPEGNRPNVLSSHPPTPERAKFFRQR
jgi:Zn-dependent protease with chaperone function